MVSHRTLVPITTWWRHQMEAFSALLAICAGNPPVHGELSAQRPVTRSFDVCFDLRLNKRFSKQSWGCWLETLPYPLWRHSSEITYACIRQTSSTLDTRWFGECNRSLIQTWQLANVTADIVHINRLSIVVGKATTHRLGENKLNYYPMHPDGKRFISAIRCMFWWHYGENYFTNCKIK